MNPQNRTYTVLELGQVSPNFITSMNSELIANQHKGSWEQLNLTKGNCLAWLNEHRDKLEDALLFGTPEKVTEYTADIGNICMKIQELYGVKPN